jgi:FKBP-type peptidyl-prolyl cis-trans isomerase SlyD
MVCVRFRLLFALGLSLSMPMSAVAQTPSAPAPTSPPIQSGASVRLEYTIKDDAGMVLDSNKGQTPLSYTQGEHEILPGLEKELIGMRAGEEKKVTVKPEDGYGTVDPSAQAEVPKDMLPATALTVGTRLMARNAAGEARPVTVKEIKDTTVVLDLNHPLAGRTLFFEVKVLGVESPRSAEPKPGAPEPTK